MTKEICVWGGFGDYCLWIEELLELGLLAVDLLWCSGLLHV